MKEGLIFFALALTKKQLTFLNTFPEVEIEILLIY